MPGGRAERTPNRSPQRSSHIRPICRFRFPAQQLRLRRPEVLVPTDRRAKLRENSDINTPCELGTPMECDWTTSSNGPFWPKTILVTVTWTVGIFAKNLAPAPKKQPRGAVNVDCVAGRPTRTLEARGSTALTSPPG